MSRVQQQVVYSDLFWLFITGSLLGVLIEEYEPDFKASRFTFVERDALIAALSDATMVIECNIKSGTMQTVDAAE